MNDTSIQQSRLSSQQAGVPAKGMSNFQKEYSGAKANKDRHLISNTANTITHGTVGTANTGFEE